MIQAVEEDTSSFVVAVVQLLVYGKRMVNSRVQEDGCFPIILYNGYFAWIEQQWQVSWLFFYVCVYVLQAAGPSR